MTNAAGCRCSDLPAFFRATADDACFTVLPNVADKQGGWVTLKRCSICGQLWQVDVWDKGAVGLAIKIADEAQWPDFEDTPVRMAYLTESREGLSEQSCQWYGCDRKALKDLAYCPVHAYEKAGLRP